MQLQRTSSQTCAAVRAVACLLLAAPAWAQDADVKSPAAPGVKTPDTTMHDATLAPPKSKDELPAPAWTLRPDHSRMYYQDADDGTWARGASYKARFANDGVELVPLFGSRAPHNMALALDLASVTVAGDALPFASDVAPKRTDDVLEFDRGAVIERYSASPKALEQSFVITSLPMRGELALHVAFDGEYTARSDGRAIEFANALGTVTCSDAVAIDAAGRRLELPLRVEGASYVIEVPADFVQRAVLPLVVDPTVTAFAYDTSPDDDFLADVAIDLGTNTWRIVYQEAISATDVDVYSSALDTAGLSVPNSGGYIDQTSERWAHPRIASNRSSDVFAIVCECGPIGSRVIKTRHVSSQSSFSSTWTVASNVGGEVFNPAIGGDPSMSGPTSFLVVYERAYNATDHDIHAHMLDSAGVPSGNVFYIDNTGNSLDELPAVSKSDGPPPASDQNWAVVWQRLALVGDHDIYAARVHCTGSVQNGTFQLTSSVRDETNPSVSSSLDTGGTSRRHVMACEVQTSATDHDVELALFSAGVVHSTDDLSMKEGWESLDQLDPHIDTDGTQFVVTYAEQWLAGFADYDVYSTYVAAPGDTLTLVTGRNALGIHSTPERNPCVVAEHSGGAMNAKYFAAWDDQGANDGNIYAAFIDFPVFSLVTTYCYSPFVVCPCGNDGASGHGCANSVNPAGVALTFSGLASVAHDTAVLHANGMPATAPCLFFEGTTALNNGSGLPFGDGRKCLGGVIVRFPLKGSVNGSASYPQAGDASISAVGFVPAIGGTRYYQAWYRDPASFCGNAKFNLSSALTVQWLP